LHSVQSCSSHLTAVPIGSDSQFVRQGTVVNFNFCTLSFMLEALNWRCLQAIPQLCTCEQG
jgi:hypothetical protein